MSWIELVGTVFYLWSVVLIARRKMLTWPVGIVAVVLFAALFWQIHLYSDAIEQGYYLVASVYGWWNWSRARADRSQPVPVAYSSLKSIAVTAAATAVLSVAVGAAMTRVHIWLPSAFPAPADYPWIDAATTVMSLVAMWLMARRQVESWIYWILIDVAGVWLYYVKDVKFVALLYVVLLALAVWGYVGWHRERRGAAAVRTAGRAA
ncbi:MAG: nicotinamide riboside transporter PnuC [Planctomycetes bacterium]|nr:nicotinamide riboside transporter PnuC [Planctomycetota bacterium]